jgi:MFS family permease
MLPCNIQNRVVLHRSKSGILMTSAAPPAPLAATPAAPPTAAAARFALGLLGLVYLLNFLDRTLIYILFTPIKAELGFSDTQLALLGSTSFVLFYTVLGVPFGRLADRVDRRRMIAVGLLTWSLFSGLTGFATSFWSLFACRLMVGVGEATLGPAAMSLLSDLFPPARRATVQSIYSAGIPLGAAAAFFLGGHIGATWGWRAAFWALGFPGIALAALVLTLPEPARGATDTKTPGTKPSASAPPAPAAASDLTRIPALRWHVFGYALFAVATNSLSIWIPTFLARVHGMALPDIGNLSALSMAVSGGTATAFGGAIADRFRARGYGRMTMSAGLALLSAPLWVLLLWSGSIPLLEGAYFLLAGLGLAWLGPAAADVHDLVGPRLRGLGTAVYFFVVNAIGYGIAPPLVGKLSDALGGATDPEAMRVALLVCPVACVLASLLLLRGNKLLLAGQSPRNPVS